MFNLREYHTENVNDHNLMIDQLTTKSFIPGGSYIYIYIILSFIVANKSFIKSSQQIMALI